MTRAGGGMNLGAVGDAGSVWLDDSDAYSIAFALGVAKEITEANSVGGATPLNAGPVSGVVIGDGSAGSLTINKAGLYEVSLASSFSSSGGAKVDGAIYLNGVRRGEISFERDISTPNDVGSVGPSNTMEILSSDLPAILTARFVLDAARTLALNHFSLHVVGAGL